jgi:adenylosuccinate synthase
VLLKVYNRKAPDVDAVVEDLLSYVDRLRPMVADTGLLLTSALDEGKTVLLEGGQATLLDVDHGTYPFVTSSNATSCGACTGSGIAPNRIDKVIAVIKAYTTRVGEGPFPTELLDAAGEKLRADGGEYGTTTGRPRRCGWYDAVIARYAARVNGVTDFVLTKLDVLTGWEKIPVCVAYEVDGVRYDEMPMTQTAFHHATPVYEHFDGWTEDITGARSFEDLPKNAQLYIRALEEMSGAPFSSVGVGPDREQTLELRPLL